MVTIANSPSRDPLVEHQSLEITLEPALRACWHPVGYANQLEEKPLGTTLLDQPVVLWRDSGRQAHAFHDLCIHRGTALSLGKVDADELVCAYHGWRYGTDGRCTRIPQLEDQSRVPAKAKASAYRCQERYGIIWVALEEPRWPLPEIPELESEAWRVVFTGPFAWQSNASRQVENFTDFGHFPFVHPGLLGDPDRTVVPGHEVTTVNNVLHYQITRPDAPNTTDFPVFDNTRLEQPQRRSRYQLHLPYTIVLRLDWSGQLEWKGQNGLVYLFASQPVTANRCIGYCVISRNYNLDQPDSVLQEFEDVIFGQDRVVVESQRPELVPFDLAAELHLKFDAVAVAYRRAMRALGLG